MSNMLPSAQQYAAKTIVKAFDECRNERSLLHPLCNTGRKPSRKPLTSERRSNPVPSAVQYGMKTVVNAVDECKNEQSAAIR